MISDKFIVYKESVETTLDRIEALSRMYNFKTKDCLNIRLLSEEIISVISPTFKLSSARAWATTTKDTFQVTIDCDASVRGLDEATKETLMKLGKASESKGVFGMISKVLGFLSSPDADYDMIAGQSLIYSSYGVGTAMPMYVWTPEVSHILDYDQPTDAATTAPEADPIDTSLEVKILQAFADNIHVSVKKDSALGARLEISVSKKFDGSQIHDIEINQH